jgi:Uma2 family endonuclease
MRLLAAPYDVFMPGADPVEPDLLAVEPDNPGHLSERGFEGVPDVVVEILSPSNRRQDLVRKQELHRSAGVLEYWQVDPDSQSVTILSLRDGNYETAFFADDAPVVSLQLEGLNFTAAEVFEGIESADA